MGGTGARFFVEPHPDRADMVIRCVTLEGPDSGISFGGRGKFQNGLATIAVPERPEGDDASVNALTSRSASCTLLSVTT